MDERTHDRDTQDPPDDGDGDPGARGGDQSPSADRLPAAPADDDTPLGDTDQHSDVSSDRGEGG
jgi:hypothetical protein